MPPAPPAPPPDLALPVEVPPVAPNTLKNESPFTAPPAPPLPEYPPAPPPPPLVPSELVPATPPPPPWRNDGNRKYDAPPAAPGVAPAAPTTTE